MKCNKVAADYSLYLVTDRRLSLGRSNQEVVAAAVAGGVSCVQLREKNLDTRSFVAEAEALMSLLQPLRIPLIINDRVDIALAVGADGVHLGQNDMKIEDARRLLGNSKIIGISAECLDHAVRAEKAGADYIGISPVYATATKADTAPPLGPEGVAEIRRRVRLPLVAIGGIHRENSATVLQAGADGLAVVSAIVQAASPQEAARELLRGIQQTRRLLGRND
ncbi:MAG: thiamine phosphate synthase [Desulfopila sp.]|jgi:thiamine-phosphate pyrophosphorylase|nr:thiamine phosphate synthase [Desulfopila sp.]